jgi:small subunit ribosomal protein S16
MSQGAKASGTIHNLLVSKKLISGKKVNVLPKKSPIKKEGEATAEAAAPESTPTAEAAPVEAPAETPAA